MATILVVDDEIGIRELLSEILGDEGHAVEVAENAQQARAFRAQQVPDLVLLDIWMPDTDGVTLLKEWSSQGLLTMPVVMMSGHATIDTAVEATRIGAINFLEKPIALQKLLSAVEQGLSRAPMHRAAEPLAPPAPPVSAGTTTMRPPMPSISSSSGIDYSTGTMQLLDLEPLASSYRSSGTAPQPPAPTPAPAPSSPQFSFDMPLREARDEFERAYFEYHLARENGSMTRVAERTGLERTHLYRKLKQLGIELGRNRHSSGH